MIILILLFGTIWLVINIIINNNVANNFNIAFAQFRKHANKSSYYNKAFQLAQKSNNSNNLIKLDNQYVVDQNGKLYVSSIDMSRYGLNATYKLTPANIADNESIKLKPNYVPQFKQALKQYKHSRCQYRYYNKAFNYANDIAIITHDNKYLHQLNHVKVIKNNKVYQSYIAFNTNKDLVAGQTYELMQNKK